MQLFYNPDITANSPEFSFDRDESRHIVKVLRKSVGDSVYVTDGKGAVFHTEIISAAEHRCTVRIVGTTLEPRSDFELHVAVAPTKMIDRFEWFLEKATELGATRITPLICDRSERKTLKTERLEKIVQSAMKQSLRAWLPVLDQPMAFGDFIGLQTKGIKLILHCEENDRKSLKSVLKPGLDVVFLIGPEGDFTSKEINKALEKGYIAATLGTNRLRTETAAVAAVHAATFINEP